MIQPPFGRGAEERDYTPTDYHADSFAKATPTPPSYSTPITTIYMQNQEPCCGADLLTQYLNVIFGGVYSPMFVWKNIRKLDGLPASSGSNSLTLGKEAKTIGACDLALMPDNSTLSNADYASYQGITTDLLNNALKNGLVASYAFIENPTMQQIKDNIYQHKAVGLRVACGDGWWTNANGIGSWAAKDVLPLHVGNYVDDHFILATGFDETTVLGPNSWSIAWGNNGMYYFNQSYIPFVRELIIFVPPVTPVTPTPATYQFLKDIRYGDTSADVHALQFRLGITATGTFDFPTLIAVFKFQIAHGIFWFTGTVGPVMRGILNSTS